MVENGEEGEIIRSVEISDEHKSVMVDLAEEGENDLSLQSK